MSIKKYVPSMLSGLSCGLAIGGLYYTVKGTIKSVRDYDELKKDNPEPTKKEVFKKVWKNYITPAAIFALSAGAKIGCSYLLYKETSGLYSSLGVAESLLATYRSKVKEEVGEEKENIIMKKSDEEICKKQLEKAIPDHPLDDDELLFYDTYSHRTFISKSVNIEDAVVKANTNMYDCGECSINDIYRYIGAGGLDEIPLGSDIGFDIDDGIIHARLVPMWGDDDKTSTVIFMSFDREPKHLRH